MGQKTRSGSAGALTAPSNAENPPKKYQDILPIDLSPTTGKFWDELKSVFEYWIEQGVKVFRVDNPHTKSMEFLALVHPNIKANAPKSFS